MSAVLVTGGTGTLGRPLVSELRGRGHQVQVLSRRPGEGRLQGDLATGAGLAEAAGRVDVVVHAASDTRRFGRTDPLQTTQLLRHFREVSHLVYISIVGIDAIPYAYYRRKLSCEELIAAGPVPYTILRATQFHELIAVLFTALGRLPAAPLPVRWRCQPVAAAEVASRLAELVEGNPSGRVADFGGPEVCTLGELAGQWRARHGRPRALVPIALPGRNRGFVAGANTCPDRRSGRQTWAEFVAGG